jgi:plastocyanin domain-containing protein
MPALATSRWLRALGAALASTSLLISGCKEDDRSSPSAAAIPAGAQKVAIKATAKGFEPPEVHVVQGKPAVLTFTRVVESSCVDAVKMPWREEAFDLPLNEPVDIVIPDTSKSGAFAYSCWMNMVHGKVVIDPSSPP